MAEINASKSLDTTPIREGNVKSWDIEADVVVLGLGETGASAAIEAAEAGAAVHVFERGWRGGGASAEYTAQLYLGGRRLSRGRAASKTPPTKCMSTSSPPAVRVPMRRRSAGTAMKASTTTTGSPVKHSTSSRDSSPTR